ncbi:MAG: single-stranded DNA-binding protein [Clostridiales bacterium]|jgi:single-strand DNA-binding protein|nr:single-stranded DNA-binding protein [Clostridiales bacterium]
MNKVILIGRLTKDPEVKNTASQVTVCRFTIAVDRKFKDQNGQRQADFISCVAWRQTANFISSYFHKGSKIAVVGSIQTRTYDDQSGQKRYVTDVVVDEAEFVDSANSNGNGNTNARSNGGYNNGGYSRQDQAPAGSTAAAAPVAPQRQIVPDMSDDTVFQGSDDELSLPFPIDDDTGNISF